MNDKNKKYWILYNGAMFYDGPAHTNDEITIKDAQEALAGGGYFCRWTSNFDIQRTTEWWWCIKDTPIDLMGLKVNKRRDIRLCLRKCLIRKLRPEEIPALAHQIALVSIETFMTYPMSYRPSTTVEEIEDQIKKEERDIWIAMEKETNITVGMAICRTIDKTVDLSVLRVPPQYNKMCVSAGLVYEICRYYINENNYWYISDGQRNIRHMTNFQDFLISTLGFRKAFCKLEIEYTRLTKILVFFLYMLRCFFRNTFVRFIFKDNSFFYNLVSVLEQERIRRSF